ncbi:exonuclease domain-containing protein [Cryptosporangium minutisporangium]
MSVTDEAGAPTWVVIDAETTGLSPKEHRLVELAIVVLDERGNSMGEAATLVNPGMDIGPADGHGIRNEDVLDAPRFDELAGWLVEWLRGKVLVGHNLLFTSAFLDEEFRRSGFEMPHVPAICTMTNAPRYLPSLPGRTLEQCCAAAGIPLDGPRSALTHARAAGELFGTFLAQRPTLPSPWVQYIERARRMAWPRIPMRDFQMAPRAEEEWEAADPEQTAIVSPEMARMAAAYAGLSSKTAEADLADAAVRGAPNPEVDSEFVAEVVEEAPRSPEESGPVSAYLGALDNAVSDRVLSFTEAIHLKDLAAALAIFEAEQGDAHRQYVRTLAATAWADKQVTDEERDDLVAVGKLLDLSETEVDGLIEETKPEEAGGSAPSSSTSSSEYEAGWYPDPYGQPGLRWYDGQNWTHHTHTS